MYMDLLCINFDFKYIEIISIALRIYIACMLCFIVQ